MKIPVITVLLTLAANSLWAQTIDIYVDPETMSDTDLTPGEWIDIDVKVDVDYAPGLLAGVFSLEFDTTVLSFVGATVGDFYTGSSNILWNNSEWSPGYYYLYGTMVAGSGNPSVGTYTMVTLTFEVVGTGTTDLILGPGIGPANTGWTVPLFYAGGEVGATSVRDGVFSNDGTLDPPATTGGGTGGGGIVPTGGGDDDDGGACAATASGRSTGLILFAMVTLLFFFRRI